MNNEEKIKKAVDIAIQYGGFDGAHHKTWVIDQVLRALLGEQYEPVIAASLAIDSLPDLDHIGTRAFLLEDVRKAWSRTHFETESRADYFVVTISVGSNAIHLGHGSTEQEALLVAILAAPGGQDAIREALQEGEGAQRQPKEEVRLETLAECLSAAEYIHGDLFGGYHGDPAKLDAFKHGMATVVNMLRAKLRAGSSARTEGAS